MIHAAARNVAICGALLTLTSSADAQVVLAERVRVQGGFITESRPTPAPRIDDFSLGVLPELALLWGMPTTQLSLTYTFTGTLHSYYASEIGNQLALHAAFELSRRTTMVLTATAAQTTLNNYLLSQPVTTVGSALYPTGSTSLVTAAVAQGISHDLSPRVVVEEHSSATLFKTLASSPSLETFNATLGGSIERVWVRDGLGVEASAGYSHVNAVPPTPEQAFVLGTVAPRWRHDWSRTVSSLVAAGGTVLVSPDAHTKPLVSPFARGSLLYSPGDSTLEVLASTGITPNPLTGQTLQAHQITVRGVTPISVRARLFIGASVGYVHGTLVDRVNRGNDYDFDSALSDAELVWQATPYLQVYGRYTFIGQDSATNALGFNPSFVRNSFLVGIALSSRPADGIGRHGGASPEVDTRFPQRVDRSDSTLGDAREEAPREEDLRRSPPPPPDGDGNMQFYTAPPAPAPVPGGATK